MFPGVVLFLSKSLIPICKDYFDKYNRNDDGPSLVVLAHSCCCRNVWYVPYYVALPIDVDDTTKRMLVRKWFSPVCRSFRRSVYWWREMRNSVISRATTLVIVGHTIQLITILFKCTYVYIYYIQKDIYLSIYMYMYQPNMRPWLLWY